MNKQEARMTEIRRVKEPLDALRGVAALGVALGSWIGVTIWQDTRFAANLLVLADFVLVIAGFIVARAHAAALVEMREVGRFALSRVVRFAPLHVTCLGLYVIADTVGRVVVGQPVPNDLVGFLSSLLLLQLFIAEGLHWNNPAWIIAAEMQMSMLFAGLCMLGIMATRTRRLVVLGVVCSLVLVRVVYAEHLLPQADIVLRSAAAFLSGAQVFFAISAEPISVGLRKLKKHFGGTAEALFLAFSVFFVFVTPDPFHALAPGVFSCCLIVFLRRRAAFAIMLEQPLMQRFGDQSYPILLLHMVLVLPVLALTNQFGRDIVAMPATILTPVYFLLLMWLSGLAVNYIEFPTRRAMWSWLDKTFPRQTSGKAASIVGGEAE
jgi:peptidoglycan/LPS O-acetylase OafA/YrhL